uniref:Uncharacterized protein n=1 Tax=viral metagenome TaxID=1070528 RepID=A0A6C0JJ61_9ZZZZ
MPATEYQINELEKFITSTDQMNPPAISCRDLVYGKKVFGLMKQEASGPDYQIFGSDGCGFHTYSLYKSKADKIYIISLTINLSGKEASVNFNYYKHLEDDTWFNID